MITHVLGLLFVFGCLFESSRAFQTIGIPAATIRSIGTNIPPPPFFRQQERKPTTTTFLTQLKSSDEPAENDNVPEPGRPDPSILVSAKDGETQKKAVIGIGAGILAGTAAVVHILKFLDNGNILPSGLLDKVLRNIVPIPMGLMIALVGVTHFTNTDAYAKIVPPKGAWGGLWQIPAPKSDALGLSYGDYHVLWSGVAEIAGGLAFALGRLGLFPTHIAASLLFLLVLAVTPANIYMFTHDATLSFLPHFKYPVAHIARAIFQIVSLAMLWRFSFA